jgi:RDD family
VTVDDLREQSLEGARYARFTRRLRGIAIDFMLFLLLLLGSLLVAGALRSDDLARVIGYAVVGVVLLYEPLLVSLTGGTVGHYLSNLRVVDDRSHGNVSFLKAVARLGIKGILGWYSFISMVATRRHQAVHDLLTRSTVQIRDPAKARPHHYSGERVDLSAAGMPSRLRRILVIGLYLILSMAVLFLVTQALNSAGVLSDVCLVGNRCSDGERILNVVLGSAWIVGAVVCIGLGWRGRLPGCRIRSKERVTR